MKQAIGNDYIIFTIYGDRMEGRLGDISHDSLILEDCKVTIDDRVLERERVFIEIEDVFEMFSK